MGTPYNKLVRDNIPDQLRAKGITFEERIAADTEYKTELIKKLSEELEEFQADGSVEELADLQEVINALKQLPEYANMEEVRLAKLADKGGFDIKNYFERRKIIINYKILWIHKKLHTYCS